MTQIIIFTETIIRCTVHRSSKYLVDIPLSSPQDELTYIYIYERLFKISQFFLLLLIHICF